MHTNGTPGIDCIEASDSRRRAMTVKLRQHSRMLFLQQAPWEWLRHVETAESVPHGAITVMSATPVYLNEQPGQGGA